MCIIIKIIILKHSIFLKIYQFEIVQLLFDYPVQTNLTPKFNNDSDELDSDDKKVNLISDQYQRFHIESDEAFNNI